VTFPDSELSSDPPQKRYMGVRVKMPVRELLRKIRLSKGLEPPPSKHPARTGHFMPASLPFPPPPPPPFPSFLLPFQSKQSAGQSPKGLEDLDILVEVLQEDLSQSQQREEPGGFGHGFSRDPRSWGSSAGLGQESCLGDFQPIPPAQALPAFRGEQGSAQRSGIFSRRDGKGSGWWVQDALHGSQRAQMLPEAPDVEISPISFSQQDLSALSFFQFQLHREENLLRNIPEEKLLAPDENGSRLLHKAVAQGRRALTFALAQRFASLNKIDEKDAEKRTALHLAAEKNQHLMVSDLISLGANVNEQDGSGRTPLHLCAENGYLRVLQVLKGCKDSGVCVEVDLPDHCG
ncbi:IKBZ inhibitor, partial [Alaudala cheleensis]|nr:IKBZ inhibitor [Alaudala cheleensis]